MIAHQETTRTFSRLRRMATTERRLPTRLLVGPWTHLEAETKGGAAVAEGLAWLDRYLGPRATAGGGTDGPPEHSVRVWVGGAQAPGWRDVSGWPPEGPREQRWYPGPGGTLDPRPSGDPGTARFRYDPADPTPSVGGAVMTFTAGERDNPHADLFVRLCDVDPKGRSRNVCDGIVRLSAQAPAAGVVRVSLIAAGHRFAPGHRIRLQVAGGALPASRATRAPARSRRPRGTWCPPSAGSAWRPRPSCCRSPGEPAKNMLRIFDVFIAQRRT